MPSFPRREERLPSRGGRYRGGNGGVAPPAEHPVRGRLKQAVPDGSAAATPGTHSRPEIGAVGTNQALRRTFAPRGGSWVAVSRSGGPAPRPAR
jgi:hypothetical protein